MPIVKNATAKVTLGFVDRPEVLAPGQSLDFSAKDWKAISQHPHVQHLVMAGVLSVGRDAAAEPAKKEEMPAKKEETPDPEKKDQGPPGAPPAPAK